MSDKGIESGVAGPLPHIAEWCRKNVPESVTIMLLAFIIGILSGVAAWLFKWSIGHLARFFLSFVRSGGLNWFLLVLPVIGILLTVAYQKWVVRDSLEHGIIIVKASIDRGVYTLRTGLCYEPIVASVLTLGFGGSAGAEGPMATVGAAIGSNVARLFGVSPDMIRMMIGCGAGAGIAGIFKAPVGGALFTLEVMKMKMNSLTVLALIVASITGALTCYALTGFTFDVQFLPKSFFDPGLLGWVTALGIFCGVYSVYYNKLTVLIHRGLKKIDSLWLRALCSSVVVAVIVFLFPAMFSEGYDVVTKLVNGQYIDFMQGSIWEDEAIGVGHLIAFGGIILLLKVVATINTNSGGGVAGDFAPTIFAGAFCGMVFALGVNNLFGCHLPVGLFALLGTAGAFAGIIHAPLMAIFLVAEMVGNGYGYFLPLSVAAAVSYITVKLMTPFSRWLGGDHDDLASILRRIRTVR